MNKALCVCIVTIFTGIIFAPVATGPEAETISVPTFPFSLEPKEVLNNSSEFFAWVTAYGPPLFYEGKKTRTGKKVGPNIAAVDPKIIPIGSIIEINGRIYNAQDTGLLIVERRVDCWMYNPKKFGNRWLKVKIIKRGKGY